VKRERRSGDVKTLGRAWRQFWLRASPRYLAVAFTIVLAVRLVLGGWSWRDAAAALFLVVVYPFGEWAIHVYLLHARADIPTTRAHMEHHREPNDLDMVLLGPSDVIGLLGLAVPAAVGIGAGICALIGEPVSLGVAVTGLLTGYLLVFGYEWCHFLIHTAYRPHSRYYKQIWRTHRLHHFKNERYWHGITNTIGDRAFHTFPDQRDVPRSKTARTLTP
jgi:hypothetical protein